MNIRARRFILFTGLLVAGAAPPMHGQWMAKAYLHANFGDVEFRRGGFGMSVGYLGPKLGFELDVDRHHHFFKDKDLSIPNPCMPGGSFPCIDDDTDAWVVMGNVVGRLRGSAATKWNSTGIVGLGVIHAWVHSAGEYNSRQMNLAFNAGGALSYRLNEHIGIVSDLRYFHAFPDKTERASGYFKPYDFGRFSLGSTMTLP